MEYKYQDKDTRETEMIKAERWGWGVIYKPTAEQIEAAETRQRERVAQLLIERDEQVAAMVKAGETDDRVMALKNEYDERMEMAGAAEGDELQQFDFEGNFHRFAEVEQGRVYLFIMYKPDEPSRRIDVVVPDGAQIFHFYRNFGFDYEGSHRRHRVYVFGYKHGEVAQYYYIMPNDRIIMADRDVDITQFNVEEGTMPQQ